LSSEKAIARFFEHYIKIKIKTLSVYKLNNISINIYSFLRIILNLFSFHSKICQNNLSQVIPPFQVFNTPKQLQNFHDILNTPIESFTENQRYVI
jgi:hypothetical protein